MSSKKKSGEKLSNEEKVYYECPSENYASAGFALNRKDGEQLGRMLCRYARELATRESIRNEAAYKQIVRQLLTVPGLEGEYDTFDILIRTERTIGRFSTPDDATGFMAYVRRTFGNTLDTMNRSIQMELFLRRFWCTSLLLAYHKDCEPRSRNASGPISRDVLIRGLELWAEINCLVPPCKYVRLEQTLADRSIVSDAARAVLQRHGADVLDDLVQGLVDGSLDESGLWGLSVLEELPHDPSFPRQPTPPVLGENKLAAAIEYVFPGWKSLEEYTTPRGGVFEGNHEYRPGWYRPAETPTNEPSALTQAVVEAATAPASDSDAPDPAIRQEETDPLYELVNGACGLCGEDLTSIWKPIRARISALGITDAKDLLEHAERAMGRMFLSGNHSGGTSRGKHGLGFDEMMRQVMFHEDIVDHGSALILGAAEKCGILFMDSLEFQAFHNGLRQRPPGLEKLEFVVHRQRLYKRLLAEVPSLTPSQRSALVRASTFLNGIDLFSDGQGDVPLATCLRIAVATARRNMGWTETYYLWKIHLPKRAEELRARLENPKTGPNDIVRMLERH